MKHIILFLSFCLPVVILGQAESAPILVQWDSVSVTDKLDFLETDSLLVSCGKISGLGFTFYWFDSSLTVTTQTYPLPPVNLTPVEMASNPTDGGYVVAGNTISATANGIGLLSLTKFSAVKHFEPVPGAADGSFLTGVINDDASGFWATGGNGIPPGAAKKTLLARFDSVGSFVFKKQFLVNDDSYANDLVQYGPEQKLALTGFAFDYTALTNSAYLLVTDSQGDSLNTTTFGSLYAKGNRVFSQDADSSLLVLGTDVRPDDQPQNIKEYLTLRKFDHNGTLTWEKEYGYHLEDSLLVKGFVFVDAQQTIDNGIAVLADISFENSGGHVLYLAKLDSAGTMLWTTLIEAQPGDEVSGTQVVPLSNGEYLVSGNVSNPQSIYSFRARLIPSSTGTDHLFEQLVTIPLSISPNPTESTVSVSWENASAASSTILIYTTEGKLVYEEELLSATGMNSARCDVDFLPAGVYLLSVKTGDQVGTRKFVKR